jgi:magnesium-transporting ATPase (P-type)
VRIVVKGAPEYVIPLCVETYDNQMNPTSFGPELMEYILTDKVVEMASAQLKVLSYAYKELDLQTYNHLLQTLGEESYEFRDEIEKDLTYIGTFGLEDPLREEVIDSVWLIRCGCVVSEFERGEQRDQVNVRMLSGDHVETCRAVAVQSGVITEEESNEPGVVITGDEFREEIGGYHKIWDEINQDYRVEFTEGRQRFDAVKKKVKVIARCTSEDKFVFVCGIKQKGGLVGMTGDSISDAEALKKADVGFCMGSGCDVAKDNSDLVILDDDFKSIHSAIKWGRSIFDNVRKFIQFQLTINFVICFVTILGGATVGAAPLNVIQMLWINLMMDILGAISIGTEPYRKDEAGVVSNRISRKDNIVKAEMYRHIVCMGIYQISVLVILMYFGGLMFFDEPFNLISTPLRDAQQKPTDRMRLNTMCFHTFFLMNWFNAFNCRVIDKDDINIFRSICNNPMFWIVLALEMAVQSVMIKAGHSTLGSALLGTAPMSPLMLTVCWVFAVLTLVMNVIIKQIPAEKFIFVERLDLEGTGKSSTWIERVNRRAEDVFVRVNDKVQTQEGELD